MSQAPIPAAGPRPTPINPNPVDFGPNVIIFDHSVNMAVTQKRILQIWNQQETSQFGSSRYAYLFKPGTYSMNVQLSYYTTAHGLGLSPDEVTIDGGVQSLGVGDDGSALDNFWRGAENIATIAPAASSINKWAVSQATFLRRFHLKARQPGNNGQLFLFDFRNGPAGPSSGGFVADSKVDGTVASGSQQQFLTRNSTLAQWDGGNWNMVFVGNELGSLTQSGKPVAPSGEWPAKPFTIVEKTPVIREKPYLIFESSSGNYAVKVPTLKMDTQGISWANTSTEDDTPIIPIDQFYIAKEGDTADSLNAALQQGFHLIMTPGIYNLTTSLEVNWPDTVILGLGMATLMPENGTPALTIADVDGVSVSGLLFDAGPIQSASLLIAGPSNSNSDHSTNPTALFDLSSRVGGVAAGLTQNCFTINSNDVILDNIWLWRADHGKDTDQPPTDVGWAINTAANGLTVNGQDVTAYGLFVEHFQGFQTFWAGNGGSVYFYQSEIPYDVPNQYKWQQNGQKGYPSYKVSDLVSTHTANGFGIYCFFRDAEGVQLDNAIETPPTGYGIQMHHMVTKWLDGKPGTSINNIINGTGGLVANSISQSPT